MLPNYMSLIHDITTPVISLISVWLGARFALRNEIRKKELDARLSRLEALSGDCITALLNTSNYLGFIACTVNNGLAVFRASKSDPQHIPYETYCLWYEEAERSSWKLDMSMLQKCQHALRFHRPVDALYWKERVDGSVDTVCEFFHVSRDSAKNPFRNKGAISITEVEAFIADMYRRCEMLRAYRNQLADQLSYEYLQMNSYVPPNFWRSLLLCRVRRMAYFRVPSG